MLKYRAEIEGMSLNQYMATALASSIGIAGELEKKGKRTMKKKDAAPL
jgi:hypothetical protein